MQRSSVCTARSSAFDGATVTAAYEFDGATLTSITSHWTSKGSSRGDVDGGFGASFLPVMGPGFIPFPSDTQDSIDLEQTTQEIRLASTGDGPLNWQVGGFYFESDFDVTTVGFTFPPPVTVNHTNEAWALFGQLSYQLTDTLRATGGIRYTDDQKDFFVRSGAAPHPPGSTRMIGRRRARRATAARCCCSLLLLLLLLLLLQ